MNAQATGTWTELANRSGDGLDVSLVWAKGDGRDEVVVRVTDVREGDYFEISAEPARALDVYYHPFAYRDFGTVVDDSRLTEVVRCSPSAGIRREATAEPVSSSTEPTPRRS